MKKKQTHILSLLFCSLLLLPLVSIIALQLWQWNIQHGALKRLENESLQSIVVTIDKLVWEKENKEVNINGELFDVKSLRVEDGKFILTGLFDKKETAIKNLLKKQAGKSGNTIIQLLVLGQCFVTIIFYLFNFSIPKVLIKRFSLFTIVFSSFYQNLIAPPPKAIVCFW